MAPGKLCLLELLDPVLNSNNDRDELVRLEKQNGVFSWSIFTRSFSCDFTGKLFVIFVYDTFICLNFCFLLKATSSQCGRIASQGMTYPNKIWSKDKLLIFRTCIRISLFDLQFENHRFQILIISAGGPKLQSTRALHQVAGMSLWVFMSAICLINVHGRNRQKLL